MQHKTNEDEAKTTGRRHGINAAGKTPTYFNFRLACILCIAAGALTFALTACLYALADIGTAAAIIFASLTYSVLVAAVILSLALNGRTATRRELLIHRFDRMLDNMVFPYIITNSHGTIVKHNHAAKALFDKSTLSAMPKVNDVLPFLTPELIKRSAAERVELQQKTENEEEGTRYIIIESTETLIGDLKKTADPTKGMYYLTTLVDITAEKRQLVTTARKLERESIVMGRAEIDDLQAFSNASGISEKDASDKVREILGDWILHQDGLMYEPETRKFIFLMPKSSFTKNMREDFTILDTVREAVSTKEEELTVSMGFSASGETLGERMRNADIAFEQRKSGNKAVVNTDGELVMFGVDRRKQASGGSTEYRRIGNTLTRFIRESSGVLIMGHSRPDYDSIGSAIGISKLVSDCNRSWHIVMNDMSDENFVRLTEDVRSRPEYEGRFISEAEALQLIRSDTLLIVTDVNAISNMESPDLYKNVCEITGGRTVILDHHEKNDNTAPADLLHIDTSYSSASEIVSGILEVFLRRTKLTADEATLLLAGIMLDTKNFTQYATGKTYAAAEYLSRCSAKAERAKKFFDADYETFSAEYSIGATLRCICDGRIAICSGKGPEDEAKCKIVIGRVADRLLNLEGVLASIVIAESDGRINASARSNNSIVNCAALFKGLGGGNFNNAGARSEDMTQLEFEKAVISNIERFMSENVDRTKPKAAEPDED